MKKLLLILLAIIITLSSCANNSNNSIKKDELQINSIDITKPIKKERIFYYVGQFKYGEFVFEPVAHLATEREYTKDGKMISEYSYFPLSGDLSSKILYQIDSLGNLEMVYTELGAAEPSKKYKDKDGNWYYYHKFVGTKKLDKAPIHPKYDEYYDYNEHNEIDDDDNPKTPIVKFNIEILKEEKGRWMEYKISRLSQSFLFKREILEVWD